MHVYGKRCKSLDDLLLAEVEEPLNTKYFIDYFLMAKYTDLYKIKETHVFGVEGVGSILCSVKSALVISRWIM